MQSILLISILIYSAIIDIKKRIVPNYILISIILISLIDVENIQLLGIFAGVPFLIGAVATNGGIGGGDVKIISCVGLILGLTGIIASLILSLFIMIIFIIIVKKIMNKNIGSEKLPMLPFLNLGFIIVCCIQKIL